MSTFALPKNELSKKNELKIPTDFTGLKNPIVRIKHFKETDIIRVVKWVVKEVKKFPRVIPKLKPDAVPCIIPNLGTYLSDGSAVPRRLHNVEYQSPQTLEENLSTYKE